MSRENKVNLANEDYVSRTIAVIGIIVACAEILACVIFSIVF